VSITHEVNSPTVSTSNLNCTIRTHVSEKIPNVSSTYPGRRKWESFPQVCSLLDKEETSDDANLSTVGSWYKAVLVSQAKRTEVHDSRVGFTYCLTFSCAEYESPDIANFLRSVNNVSSSCDIGKLYTEDPISVSIKFSNKFHAFFNTVLMKGKVLGKVDHFYWKKEYQARGVPHYHVLLWIQDAPVIGQDDPCCLGSRRGLHAKSQTRKPVLNYTGWLPGTKCTNAAHTAKGNASALLAL